MRKKTSVKVYGVYIEAFARTISFKEAKERTQKLLDLISWESRKKVNRINHD